MSLTSKCPKLARASSAWQGWILYQEVWRDHCLELWRYSQRCNGDTRMLGWPTLLAICWRYQLALCETSQKVRVPGLAAVWRTEGAGFFKASGSQNDGTTNPRGQAWSHRVSRFPFLWILVLFDQLILPIIPFLHPALGWKHLLYVTVYWRYIIWYIRWEFDFREANGWKRALSLRWSCTSALKQSILHCERTVSHCRGQGYSVTTDHGASESQVEFSETVPGMLPCLFNPFSASEHGHEYCDHGTVFSEDQSGEGSLPVDVWHTMTVVPRLDKTFTSLWILSVDIDSYFKGPVLCFSCHKEHTYIPLDYIHSKFLCLLNCFWWLFCEGVRQLTNKSV